ncbi:hypothetical protein ACHAXA_008188 [Cyclostephanos tholiformis]|uniref:BING4 C-terminal domain-containing protein n=1 Tax=Cyclostephanos tholiformis TaxID=382380 RepID=A0ABD3SCW8_9STRA
MTKDATPPPSSTSDAADASSSHKRRQAGFLTRGMTHAEILSRRKSLRAELHSLPPDERSRVLSHLHGDAGRGDLSRSRIANLRRDDRDRDTRNLTDYQSRSLDKRRAKPNMSLQRSMHRRETKRLQNAMLAADAEDILRPHVAGKVEVEDGMERTVQLTQRVLRHDPNMLPEGVARNVYDLELNDYGPYRLRYDRSGRHALLAGHGGHVSVVDQHTMALRTEFHLRGDTIRDACFLHNGSMMAVSQENNVYIYDDNGAEIHRLDGHRRVTAMEFLPYHWLLATIGNTGVLQYQDTSTGALISQHRSKLGPCHAMRQSPFNSVIHLGHTNGTVTLWSPSSSEYLVKMLCHKGSPITSLAIDRGGRYMVTGGGDSRVKIFDLRMYKEVHSYNTYGGPPSCLDISQTGMLGIGHGCHTTYWSPDALRSKAKEPYMKHQISGKGPMESLRFRPYEDVVGIGHAGGVSSIVVPGSGEPNLDSMEHFTNPYMDSKQRREAEVRSLLEKLSPDMISLDPDVVGGIEESNLIQRQQRLRDMAMEADARKAAKDEEARNKKDKKRMRGRSKIAKKLRRKQKNIVDENVMKLRELRDLERAEREKRQRVADSGEGEAEAEAAPVALKRFF